MQKKLIKKKVFSAKFTNMESSTPISKAPSKELVKAYVNKTAKGYKEYHLYGH